MQQAFQITDTTKIRSKVLNWLQPFDTFCFLDSHGYEDPYGQWDWIVAAGADLIIEANTAESLSASMDQLDQALHKKDRWWFGHLGFGLKEDFYGVSNALPDPHQMKAFSFFSPQILIRCKKDLITITADNPAALFKQLESEPDLTEVAGPLPLSLQGRWSKEEYIRVIGKIKEHIQLGDCYEMNFCQEFYAEQVQLSPLAVYSKLSKVSPVPFAVLYRQGPHWLMAASPERFLRRRNSRLISQPMKGTARRDKLNLQRDLQISTQLQKSQKERSENVMIVDLVRNDLSRICKPGSVKVDELFGVYPFPQVHQLISTVSGELLENLPFSTILKATFPMGSMTGAPKKRVLELTEQYERSARGLYSGSVGYIDLEGNFDFNVVIRSLIYRADTGYLSFHVGGGITAGSEPLKEWEECQLKATALLEVLGAEYPA